MKSEPIAAVWMPRSRRAAALIHWMSYCRSTVATPIGRSIRSRSARSAAVAVRIGSRRRPAWPSALKARPGLE